MNKDKEDKEYIVTATLKYPSANDSGCEIPVFAKNKAEAKEKAKRVVWHECLYDFHDGPIKYVAREVS